MPQAIWSGAINFGLVMIPVKLFTAVRENEISFNQLHKKDNGRINYKRVCSVDGKEVPWGEIVKGYKLDDDRYVTLTDEDIKSVSVEATQSIDITQFVDLAEIDPMYFDKPYYLEPEKKGRHAYALLREALRKSNKVGIAKVVIRTREYLAAVKPEGAGLVLELMHFADELVPAENFDFPPVNEKVTAGELKVANMLIDSLTAPFKPQEFEDTYQTAVLQMIEARAKGVKPKKGQKPSKARAVEAGDLMDVLQESLRASKGKKGGAAKPAASPKRTKR
jgi:DNA end-binding protein Ku